MNGAEKPTMGARFWKVPPAENTLIGILIDRTFVESAVGSNIPNSPKLVNWFETYPREAPLSVLSTRIAPLTKVFGTFEATERELAVKI